MKLINYLITILISALIFLVLCVIIGKLKDTVLKHNKRILDMEEYFPLEEILSFKQLYYLIIIMIIYFCIMNFFFNVFYNISAELFLVNSIIDILFSVYIAVSYYDGSTKSKILCIFLMPLASLSSIMFGRSIILFWDFLRIPTLLYMVVHYYHRFREFTKENGLDKLILILVSVIYFTMVITVIVENENPLYSLTMVTNAFTSNGYAVLGKSSVGALTQTLLAWSGYILGGIGTATLAAAIIQRNSKKKYEKLEEKIDNLERIINENQKGDAENKEDNEKKEETINKEKEEEKNT